jgi:hypothetical protein
MSKARELAELGAVYDSGALSNRNMIINGNMEIAQRGTSQTSAGYGTLDRFNMSLSGATATMTQESFTIGQTDVPGSDKYLKLAVSTGNNNSGVYYKIEAKDAIAVIGKKVTASYYAKGTSPAAGLQVAMEWYDGSSSSPSSSTTVTLTSSWVKYTHTFDVPSISGLTLTNANAYLEIKWAQANADTGTGAYEVNLAQVQLEVGTEATPFEHRSFGDELALCQRYYHYQGKAANTALIGGYHASADDDYCGYTVFPTQMRATPTFTRNGTFTVFNCGQPNAIFLSKESCTLYANVSGPANWYAHANGTDDFFEWDAEL